MRDNFHAGVNNTWYSVLFDHKLTKLFSTENFSGAKHAGKVLIIIIILFIKSDFVALDCCVFFIQGLLDNSLRDSTEGWCS